MLLRSLPRMSRPHALVELSVWAFMAVPMGVLSGGVAGVLVNTVFETQVAPWLLAIAVALLTGAGSFANMTSAVWAHWARGRRKVATLARLQALFAASLCVAAIVPIAPPGLAALVAGTLAAQVLWCGIITIRASIWRLNFNRTARTAFAAQNQILVSLIHAAVGVLTGWLVQQNVTSFRFIYLIGAVCAVLGLLRLRAVRMRRERQIIAAEKEREDGRGFSPAAYWSILRQDALYRRYMGWMMVLGSGNLMFMAPLILIMTRSLNLPSFEQVLITAALPTLVAPFATPFWARYLASRHVIAFRVRNSCWYAAALLLFALGVQLGSAVCLWAGAALLGVGIGGGTLGWNLGHNDFAPDDRVAEYLGLHITLTGLRGLVAPIVGVSLYGGLEALGPGLGDWAILLPLTLTSTGALGFYLFNRSRAGTRPETSPTTE